MTTEDDFQAALDANPSDWQTRLVFADWLDERGDLRGPGYRALGMMRNAPDHFFDGGHAWTWWKGSPALYRREYLSADWWELLTGGDEDSEMTREYLTRRAADDAAARAFAKLSPGRRARLLAGRQTSSKAEPSENPGPRPSLFPGIDLGDGHF
jgi:uncharacterized protein (TIGR02996 family)